MMLFQTSAGKDITLHVSTSNPALLLYQKFGFKEEEFIIDFYDKYFPEESKECRHAFFLRFDDSLACYSLTFFVYFRSVRFVRF